jgi:hypothetical protein
MNEKKRVFKKQCWENWTSTCKRMKLGFYFISYTKINIRLTKDLNVRPKIVKLPRRKYWGRTTDRY